MGRAQVHRAALGVPTAVLRGAEVANPLEVALGFLEKWAYEADVDASPMSFEEADLRRANRGGARISGAEIAAILERRRKIERALRAIPAGSSLAVRSIPWAHLTQLFDAFAGIRGVGFSKMTKALHKKRPARFLPPSEARTGPASPGLWSARPERWPFHCCADRTLYWRPS